MVKYEVHRLDMKDFSLPSVAFGKDLKHSTANALAELLGAGASDRYIFLITTTKEAPSLMSNTMTGTEIDNLIAQLYKFHGPEDSTNVSKPVFAVLQGLQKARNAYWEAYRNQQQQNAQNYYQAVPANKLPEPPKVSKYSSETMLEIRKEALRHALTMSPHGDTSKSITIDADVFAQFLYGNIVA